MTASGEQWMEHMRHGRFESAWEMSDRILSEHRGQSCWHLPRHQQWIWNGDSPEDKRVLVRCYHGLGDTLQFIRYLPQLSQMAREITVWCQPALIPLLSASFERIAFLPLHDGVLERDYDIDIEVMELPHVFRTTLATIPATGPYLNVTPRVPHGGTTRAVGLVWKAGDWDPERSIPFSELAPLWNVRGITWHSLQCGPARHERPASIGVDSSNEDILETARTIRRLSLLITVDSMPAHLAGGLACPVWLLLQKHADWRWMHDRADSPWYPTMRLFRQSTQGSWESVIREVAERLGRE